MKKQSGMTLIEMMITVAVLGILTAIAVPNMASFVRDARLTSQADLLASSMGIARLEAIKQRKNMVICPAINPNSATDCSSNAADWSKGWLLYYLDGGGTKTILKRFQAKKNLTITTTATSVEFNPTLGNATAAASFVLCATGRLSRQVDISLPGRATTKINTTSCV
jgi:type IV fimbrial biogenesis protein FimT